MVKFGSYTTILNVSFEEFNKEFDENLHFALKGIKKRFLNFSTVEVRRKDFIRVWERKFLHCNYYPDSYGNTVVEYTAEMTVFSLVLNIFSLFLLVGFLYFPIYFFGGRFAASRCRNRVMKYGPSMIQSTLPRELTNTSTKLKETMGVPEVIIMPPPHPQTTKNAEENYFLILNKQQKGPYSLEKIKLLIEVEQINGSTPIWKEGLLDWVSVNDLQEVKALL